MKTRSAKLGVILIVFVGLGVTAHSQPSRERIIVRMPAEKDEPLEITDIKVNGQSVSLGKGFMADDEWLGSLVISVRNKSDKTISYASIDLRFPRPPGSEEAPGIHNMSYGNSALKTRRPTAGDPVSGMSPGEIVEMRLSDQQFLALRDFLTAIKYPRSIDHLDLGIGHIIFADDTMWYAGSIARRDPKDTTRWINSQFSNSKPQ